MLDSHYAQRHTLPLTQYVNTLMAEFVPMDYRLAYLYNVFDVIDYTLQAVARGGFLANTCVLDDNMEPVLPIEYWDAYCDESYRMMERLLGEDLTESLSYTGERRGYEITNVIGCIDYTAPACELLVMEITIDETLYLSS